MSPELPCPVLIVCDDPEARKLTVDALAREGCERTFETDDVDAALLILDRERSIRGLVIAARQMGLLNGYDLARIAAREWPYIKNVVIIGSKPPGTAELPQGTYFLPRPLEVDVLMAALRQGPRSLPIPIDKR